jgi:translation elongation factor EF-G
VRGDGEVCGLTGEVWEQAKGKEVMVMLVVRKMVKMGRRGIFMCVR